MEISDIDAEIERLTKLREQAQKEEEERKKLAGLEEARDILGNVVNELRRLDELGYIPPRLEKALTDEKGKFNPGLYIKRPKRVGSHDDHDSSE